MNTYNTTQYCMSGAVTFIRMCLKTFGKGAVILKYVVSLDFVNEFLKFPCPSTFVFQ